MHFSNMWSDRFAAWPALLCVQRTRLVMEKHLHHLPPAMFSRVVRCHYFTSWPPDSWLICQTVWPHGYPLWPSWPSDCWFDTDTIVDFIPQSRAIKLASVQHQMSSLNSNFVSVVKSHICSETLTEIATQPNIAKDCLNKTIITFSACFQAENDQ